MMTIMKMVMTLLELFVFLGADDQVITSATDRRRLGQLATAINDCLLAANINTVHAVSFSILYCILLLRILLILGICPVLVCGHSRHLLLQVRFHPSRQLGVWECPYFPRWGLAAKILVCFEHTERRT